MAWTAVLIASLFGVDEGPGQVAAGPGPEPPLIERWGVFEMTLTAHAVADNPFVDVNLFADFWRSDKQVLRAE